MADVFGLDEQTMKDVIHIVRMFRRYGWLANDSVPPIKPVDESPTPIYVTNDSEEEIPAYACMQVTGTREIGEQNFLIVDKPADATGAAGPFIFNSSRAIADGDDGVAQDSTVVRAFKNTGTVTAGERWSPVSGQWYIAQGDGGPFVATGGDDVETNVLKVVTSVNGNTVYVAELKEAWSTGVANCDIYSMDGVTLTDTTIDADVYDPLEVFSSLTTGDSLYVTLQNGKYYAVNNAPCPA